MRSSVQHLRMLQLLGIISVSMCNTAQYILMARALKALSRKWRKLFSSEMDRYSKRKYMLAHCFPQSFRYVLDRANLFENMPKPFLGRVQWIKQWKFSWLSLNYFYPSMWAEKVCLLGRFVHSSTRESKCVEVAYYKRAYGLWKSAIKSFIHWELHVRETMTKVQYI